MPGLLIVDDEELVRFAIQQIIVREGLDVGPVAEASTGEQAIHTARQMQPSIVVMDVRMPGLDGLEATRLIRAEQPNTRVIVLTAYEEFSFAQEALRLGAVDYLLKPVRPSTLIEVLTRARDQVRREEDLARQVQETQGRLQETLSLAEARLVDDLVHGMAGQQAAVDRVLSRMGKSIRWPAVMVVDIDRGYAPLNDTEALEFGSLSGWLTEIVRGALSDPNRCLVGQIEQGVVAAIVSTDQKWKTSDDIRSVGHAIRYAVKMRALARGILRDALSNTPVTATVGIGHRYRDLGSVPQSYEGAMRARRYMLYQGRDSVIHIDDILAAAHSGLDYPIELEHDLLACVRQGNRQSSVEIIGRLADHLLVQPQESPEVVRTRLTELVALISRAIIAAGASSSQTLEVSHRQMTALASLQTPEEIREWAAASVSDLVSGIRPPDSGDTAVDRATRYVREKHRRPDLKLEEVANNVHLSPSHLARLFKAKMGVSYVKYLTSVRMEDAKRLLRTTEMTVGAVATAVGYEDSPYFHRVFRRETGMTPANYRHVTRVKNQSEHHAVQPSNVRKE